MFIDWDGTLSNSRFWEGWNGTERYLAIQQTLFVEGENYLRLWMTGYVPFATVLQYVEQRTGIPYDELKDELRRSAEAMRYIDESDIILISELRSQGTKVVIATDNMDTFRHWTIPAMKLYDAFDSILVSDTQGALKCGIDENGESAFFGNYLAENTIASGESVLIDNSIDAKSVEEFGIDFLHVNDGQTLHDHLINLAGLT